MFLEVLDDAFEDAVLVVESVQRYAVLARRYRDACFLVGTPYRSVAPVQCLRDRVERFVFVVVEKGHDRLQWAQVCGEDGRGDVVVVRDELGQPFLGVAILLFKDAC